jgi:putative lipase involved disintegration of autophagic bodies
MLTLLPNALQFLISSILWTKPEPTLEFHLRHSHALSGNTSRNVFADAPNNLFAESFTFQPRYTRTYRASSQDAFNAARLKSYQQFQSDALLEWDEEELNGPDVTSRETLLLLAKMTNNAYFEPGEKGWYDLGNDWNSVSSHFCL